MRYLLTGILAVTGAVMILTSGSGVPPPSLPTAVTQFSPAHGRAMQAIQRRIPSRLSIPTIGVAASVVPEGLDSSGQLEVPPLFAANLVGWWQGGPAPGQDGAAVIDGHVDNVSGPLVFWRLKDLRPGDRITVSPSRVIFIVTGVTETSKNTFPWQAVYGTTTDPELRLITCGGTFDYRTGHYLDNVIVFAREVAS